MSNKIEIEDLVAQGFHRLDENLIELRPPRITWLDGYKKKSPEAKIEYLEKLASTMNHAARLVSDERDKMVELCVKKEKQLEVMSKQIEANNDMLQQEVTRMNAQRQGYNTEIARLGDRVRELESGNKH